jgi:hypothetical protein
MLFDRLQVGGDNNGSAGQFPFHFLFQHGRGGVRTFKRQGTRQQQMDFDPDGVTAAAMSQIVVLTT